ncbi:hypothetical protein FBY40_0055 [Microbacterium sp. SLBN-154]|uniref:DUF6325 family protein n=1 Tax=Microbacterium sp. SLBN-154 TaxID=2768458 RepID=UPI00114D5A6D|nr:DUF6325 family protein [Microbacterium sp. SLBN-154]TQK17578.1 hypothetical protein FBY40_0055 [Microbacterium sp. SLBN-154]
MVEFRYGPVELYLVGFDSDRPHPDAVAALREIIESGVVRLLDLVVLRKSAEGDIEMIEVEEQNALGIEGIELFAAGLTASEDIDELAELIAPGSSAVLVALEMTYVRALAEKVAQSGGTVLTAERIPAPVVNAVADMIDAEEN